jgi:DNA-binding SARP family transcriptional activator
MPRDDLILPPIKRRIYDIVNRHHGISAERLRELVWIDDPSGGPEDRKTIHIHVHQLNRLLRPYGIEVRGSVSGGYRVQSVRRTD